MINKNLYNPIPLHYSTSDWYQNKRTYHGVHRLPIAPVGVILPFIVSTDDVSVREGYQFHIQVRNAVTDDVVGTTVVDAVITIEGNVASLYCPETIVQGATEGAHYYRVYIGDHFYCSEPFMWRNVENMIRIQYKRNTYIAMNGSLVAFPSVMEMYIDSEIMMPEYKYETEVESLDGFMYIRKKVSYKEYKFSFLCTDYFAEAIRMMWHCNSIVIEQHGERYDVEYMDAPQPSWNADNHFAEMAVAFRTDTIIQTNGESVENSGVRGMSFDGSFDGSFE